MVGNAAKAVVRSVATIGKIYVLAVIFILVVCIDEGRRTGGALDSLCAVLLIGDIFARIVTACPNPLARRVPATFTEFLSNALPITVAVLFVQWWQREQTIVHATVAFLFVALACVSIFGSVMKWRKLQKLACDGPKGTRRVV